MTRNLAVGVVCAVVLAGCSGKSETSTTTVSQSAGPFTVAARFAPDPPKQGPETLTVRISDASDHAIAGATVTIKTNMPTMAMAGPTLAATDNGDGTYAAQTNLNYATRWTFDVNVAARTGNGTARFTQDVK